MIHSSTPLLPLLNSPSCTATHIVPVRQTARPGRKALPVRARSDGRKRQQDWGLRGDSGQAQDKQDKSRELHSGVLCAVCDGWWTGGVDWSPLYLLFQLHYISLLCSAALSQFLTRLNWRLLSCPREHRTDDYLSPRYIHG